MDKADLLIAALRRHVVASAEELRDDLGISQPRLSRMINEVGTIICRLGRARTTRYALTREVPLLGRRVPVYCVSELGTPAEVGTLHFFVDGSHWLEYSAGYGQQYRGLPPFVEDMRPQGYIGRAFPSLHPDLKLPGRISDWSNDHHLIAVALRGEDCVGNVIVGEESFNRFYASPPLPRTRADYFNLARGALAGQPGSSAGGEHPKFAAFTEGRHLLVKFAGGDGAAADRWRDLLICEHLALEVLQGNGIAAARSEWFDLAGERFLEIERFDRVGRRGRRAVISLMTVNNYYLDGAEPLNWSKAAHNILNGSVAALAEEDADRLIWLDTFGDLIANTDRHFGNISFFTEFEQPRLSLAPVYDMLPMAFAPKGATLPNVTFTPRPPTAMNHHIWYDAAQCALRYWDRCCGEDDISSDFRQICFGCRDTLARLVSEM